MTPQQIFDKVATHMLAQGVKSQTIRGDGEVFCRYRGDEDLQCAAGCLIDDKVYLPSMEGMDVDDLMHEFGHRLPDWFRPNQQLISHLQIVHDGWDPPYWKNKLHDVAIEFGLNTMVLQ